MSPEKANKVINDLIFVGVSPEKEQDIRDFFPTDLTSFKHMSKFKSKLQVF